MAGFNGAGVFVRTHDWTADADAAVNIRADRMDEEDDGFATGLSNCLTRDGQSPATANIPLGGFKITGVGAPTVNGDALMRTVTTWTPADGSGAGLTFSNVSASYTQIGNMIFAHGTLQYPVTADTSHATISGLPVASANQTYARTPFVVGVANGVLGVGYVGQATQNSQIFLIFKATDLGFVTNANLSTLTLFFTACYPVS